MLYSASLVCSRGSHMRQGGYLHFRAGRRKGPEKSVSCLRSQTLELLRGRCWAEAIAHKVALNWGSWLSRAVWPTCGPEDRRMGVSLHLWAEEWVRGQSRPGAGLALTPHCPAHRTLFSWVSPGPEAQPASSVLSFSLVTRCLRARESAVHSSLRATPGDWTGNGGRHPASSLARRGPQ